MVDGAFWHAIDRPVYITLNYLLMQLLKPIDCTTVVFACDFVSQLTQLQIGFMFGLRHRGCEVGTERLTQVLLQEEILIILMQTQQLIYFCLEV